MRRIDLDMNVFIRSPNPDSFNFANTSWHHMRAHSHKCTRLPRNLQPGECMLELRPRKMHLIYLDKSSISFLDNCNPSVFLSCPYLPFKETWEVGSASDEISPRNWREFGLWAKVVPLSMRMVKEEKKKPIGHQFYKLQLLSQLVAMATFCRGWFEDEILKKKEKFQEKYQHVFVSLIFACSNH